MLDGDKSREEKMEKGSRRWSRIANAMLNKMVREDLTTKVTYEQRPKWRHVINWGVSGDLGQGDIKCKCLDTGV